MSINGGFLVFVIVLPIALAIGVACFTYAVVKRWKRDDKSAPDRMFYYETTPGMSLEDRVKAIHEARELAELRARNSANPPPQCPAPPPAYTPPARVNDSAV